MKEKTFEKLFLTAILSGFICLIMYIITAILFALDGIALNETIAGVIAFVGYFVVPFAVAWKLDIVEDSYKGN